MPYQIHDISNRQLRFGYWFLNHKDKLKAVLILLLGVFCLITVGYGLYGTFIHLKEMPQINQLIKNLALNHIDFSGIQQRTAPQALKIFQPTVIYLGNNQYDLYVLVSNPNQNYAVKRLVYYFKTTDFSSTKETISLFPGQQAMLLSLGNQSPRRLAQVSLEIEQLEWQRIKSLETFPKLDFELTPVTLDQNNSEGRKFGSFQATNQSIYNFREVKWQIVMYSGQKIVGLNQLSNSNFLSNETREITFSWFEKLPQVSKVDVYPIIDLYLEDIIYQAPSQPNETDVFY